jgi:hypothetical protein
VCQIGFASGLVGTGALEQRISHMGVIGACVGIADPVFFGAQGEGPWKWTSSMNRLVRLTGLGFRRLLNFVLKAFGL